MGQAWVFDRQETIDNAKIVREKFEKAAEVMKDGICQVGMATTVKAVRIGMTVEGWWRKMKGE